MNVPNIKSICRYEGGTISITKFDLNKQTRQAK